MSARLLDLWPLKVKFHDRLKAYTLGRRARRIRYADPLHAGRHPMQVYILLVCVLTGLPSLFGLTTPNSIRSSFPEWLSIVWALFLTIGAITALVGTYWTGAIFNGLTIERVGLALVGVAAIIYAATISLNLDLGGILAASIIAGFGWSALRRARDIGHIIRTALINVQVERASSERATG